MLPDDTEIIRSLRLMFSAYGAPYASTETGHELRSVSNREQIRLCETRPRRPNNCSLWGRLS
jgi:hypothetical protein